VVRALARPAGQSAHGALSGAALRTVGLATRRDVELLARFSRSVRMATSTLSAHPTSAWMSGTV
jgi:hypothetical protein